MRDAGTTKCFSFNASFYIVVPIFVNIVACTKAFPPYTWRMFLQREEPYAGVLYNLTLCPLQSWYF
jgi:hypothetical protein